MLPSSRKDLGRDDAKGVRKGGGISFIELLLKRMKWHGLARRYRRIRWGRVVAILLSLWGLWTTWGLLMSGKEGDNVDTDTSITLINKAHDNPPGETVKTPLNHQDGGDPSEASTNGITADSGEDIGVDKTNVDETYADRGKTTAGKRVRGKGKYATTNSRSDHTKPTDPYLNKDPKSSDHSMDETTRMGHSSSQMTDGTDSVTGHSIPPRSMDETAAGMSGGTHAPPADQTNRGDSQLWSERQSAVVHAFQYAWKAYETYAWGMDHLLPLSRKGEDWFHLGLTIIDAMDTMYLMGLEEPLKRCEAWVEHAFHPATVTQDVNLFETTIRVLGGLLSMHALTGDPRGLYRQRAVELGDRLLGAFETPTGIPLAGVHLATGKGVAAHFNGGASSTAEVATLALEFKYLSHITGQDKYHLAVDKVSKKLKEAPKSDGLVPIFINPRTGTFVGKEIRLGSRGDSYYEYLLKQYLQTSRQESTYLSMYEEAMYGVERHLIAYTTPHNYLFIGELLNGLPSNPSQDVSLHPKMDHLVCFMAGNLALGATLGKPLSSHDETLLTSTAKEQLRLGKELADTCYASYTISTTGLAGEITYFQPDPNGGPDPSGNARADKRTTYTGASQDMYIKPLDRHNLLRPETVESLFILWRLTGDIKYREQGWLIFQAFEQYAKVPNGAGYSSLHDVTTIPAPMMDKMESFYLAETLKYLYLLFDDRQDLLPLDQWVFNTEAHPLPVFKPSWDTSSVFSS